MANNIRWQLGQLDALRGIAIVNVILVHSIYWSSTHVLQFRWQFLTDFFYAGQRGVQLFFLVSAFTLYMSYDNRRNERHPTRNFLLRRLFRITPMFYLATVLTVLLRRSEAGPVFHILLSMLYLNGFSPATMTHGAIGSWSIATEASFYACLPFCFRWIRTLKQAALMFSVTFTVRIILVKLLAGYLTARSYWELMSLPSNLPVFALGIVLYFFWKRYIAGMDYRAAPAKVLSALALLVSAAAYIEQPPAHTNVLITGALMQVFLTLGLLIYPWRIFVNSVTIFLGKISFSVYLLHFFVAHAIQGYFIRNSPNPTHALPQALVVFLCTLLGTVPLAVLTWKFIEEPGVQLGRVLIAKLEGRSGLRGSGPVLSTLATPVSEVDEQF